MNDNTLFLTENRRDVLHGESDWNDQSIANEKSRIRKRARLALDELIEVAESPEIDNSDVFDPDDVADLLFAILTVDSSNVRDEPPTGLTTNYDAATDEYQAYMDRIMAAGAQPLAHKYTDE